MIYYIMLLLGYVVVAVVGTFAFLYLRRVDSFYFGTKPVTIGSFVCHFFWCLIPPILIAVIFIFLVSLIFDLIIEPLTKLEFWKKEILWRSKND